MAEFRQDDDMLRDEEIDKKGGTQTKEQEYDDDRYDDYDDYDEVELREGPSQKAITGYRIVIIALAVILVALSMAYYKMHSDQIADYKLLEQDKQSMQVELDSLVVSFDNVQYQNDTITARLEEAKELIEDLKNERRLNYNKLRQYQKEVGTLRTIMQGYLRQIDSLNNVNEKLSKENVKIKKQISTERLRAEMAEEKASEMENKVKVGAALKVGRISMVTLNKKGKEVTRIKNAERVRVDFTLLGNELAEPGARTMYVCIYSPEGYVLANADAKSFSFEGEPKIFSASREIDYQNENLDVSIFYANNAMKADVYKIEIYCDGRLIGTTEQAFK